MYHPHSHISHLSPLQQSWDASAQRAQQRPKLKYGGNGSRLLPQPEPKRDYDDDLGGLNSTDYATPQKGLDRFNRSIMLDDTKTSELVIPALRSPNVSSTVLSMNTVLRMIIKSMAMMIVIVKVMIIMLNKFLCDYIRLLVEDYRRDPVV